MIIAFKKIKMVVLGLFLQLFVLFAQPGFIIKSITALDGLPSELVKDAVADHNNLLWIASDQGIFIYNGSGFIQYARNSIKQYAKDLALINNRILVASDDGLFVINLPQSGLINQISFKKLYIPQDELHYPKDIGIISNDTVLIGFVDGIAILSDSNIVSFPLPKELISESYNHTFSFFKLHSNIYALSQKGYLFNFTQNKFQFLSDQINEVMQHVEDVARITQNTVLLAGAAGLYRLEINHNNIHLEELSDLKQLTAICPVDNRYFLLGSQTQGLLIFDSVSGNVQQLNPDILSINKISRISGNHYIVSTDEGIFVLERKIVHQFQEATTRYVPQALLKGNTYYFTDGLSLIEMDTRSFHSYHLIENSEEEALITTFDVFDNFIAIGRWGNQIELLEKRQNSVSYKKRFVIPDEIDAFITQVKFSDQDNLWILNKEKKAIYRYYNDAWTVYDSSKGINTYISRIIIEPSGKIFLGGISVDSVLIYQYKPDEDRFEAIRFELPQKIRTSVEVNDILPYSDGYLIATSAGLFQMDSGHHLAPFSFPEWIPKTNFTALAKGDHFLAFGTVSGVIIKFGQRFIQLTRQNNLSSNTVTTGGLAVDRQGRIFVATANGISMINTDQLNQFELASPTILEIKINNEPLKDFMGEFAYKCTLELIMNAIPFPLNRSGHLVQVIHNDTESQDFLIEGNRLILPSMDYGTYRLIIKAFAPGFIDSDPVEMNFIVKKPFYLNNTFIAIIVIIFIFLLYLIYTLIQTKKMIKEREQSLKDLGYKFSFHLSRSPIGYIEFDDELNIVFYNEYVVHLFTSGTSDFDQNSLFEWKLKDESGKVIKLSDILNSAASEPETSQWELEIAFPDRIIYTEWLITPVLDEKKRVKNLLALIIDHTKDKEAQKEKEQLIEELKEALENVKELKGLIPICANCKKIRDDSGYWEQIEVYITKHSDADFSHSLCPDCAKELYPEIYARIEKKNKDKK